MLLGLVSDTHDDADRARVAADLFRGCGCDLVLHLGDVTGPEVVDAFAGLDARFLRGNNDVDPRLDRALARHGLPRLQDSYAAVLAGVRVAAHHGHLRPAWADEPELLLHGHTHRRQCERVGRTLVVNPGALHRAPVKTVALLDLPSMDVTYYEVDARAATRMPR